MHLPRDMETMIRWADDFVTSFPSIKEFKMAPKYGIVWDEDAPPHTLVEKWVYTINKIVRPEPEDSDFSETSSEKGSTSSLEYVSDFSEIMGDMDE
jgi:hypothetical protein